MNSTVKFYHNLPSEPGYQPNQDGAAIKSLYQMEGISDDDSLSEDDDRSNTAVAMEEIDLVATSLPIMIWTPTKYNLMINGEKNAGTILPGYKPVFKVKRKGSNHPTCIVKDATESLRETFHGLTVNLSTVHRHITEKLEFTLTRTQARCVNPKF
ncbi:hypothetical protein BD560DRAFT_429215 [Blakeslea trispora]|nr:hypothetical protein BD560DRAFT_429215 [Blakeslea trispora]